MVFGSGRFTQAMFDDFLSGQRRRSLFCVESAGKRSAPLVQAGKVETTLLTMAQLSFADLLRQKTEEALEQRSSLEAAAVGAEGL